MSLSHKQTIAIHKWLLWGCFCGVCRPLYINMSPDKISIDIYYQISLHSKQYNLGFWNSFAMFFFLVGYPDQMKDHIAYIEGIWISLHVLLIPPTCLYDEKYGISISRKTNSITRKLFYHVKVVFGINTKILQVVPGR